MGGIAVADIAMQEAGDLTEAGVAMAVAAGTESNSP